MTGDWVKPGSVPTCNVYVTAPLTGSHEKTGGGSQMRIPSGGVTKPRPDVVQVVTLV